VILSYLVSLAFGVATIAAGSCQYLSYLGQGSALLIEIGILALFCAINIAGVSLSAAAENVMTVLETVPLVIIALPLFPHIRPAFRQVSHRH
jgi:amino acid transporter